MYIKVCWEFWVKMTSFKKIIASRLLSKLMFILVPSMSSRRKC